MIKYIKKTSYEDFLKDICERFTKDDFQDFKDKEFSFKFNNSIEHWYPQHPTDIVLLTDKDGLDDFGNLCLVNSSINSRFSNLPPASKIAFSKSVDSSSLKLRLMAKITATKSWMDKCKEDGTKQGAFTSHHKKMISLLKKYCN